MELHDQRGLDVQEQNKLRDPPDISVVIPCYNEQEVIHETTARLLTLLEGLKASGEVAENSAIYCVDDGSRDSTWAIIKKLSEDHPSIFGIKLSRNCGHQNALFCGLMTTPGDALISIDADLQDDPQVIPQMVRAFREGSEIVCAVRRRRDSDNFFKRFTAQSYYKFLAFMGVQIIHNHADYRLMSRLAVESLRSYGESHLFLRGLILQLGYRRSIVEFDRAERYAGESKYPLGKMIALAWQGITSFTAYPLRMITGTGVVISLASLTMAAWALFLRIFTEQALPGWASTVIPMYFLGGVQLLSIGIIGEYLAKIYEASKQRPRYHLETTCGRNFKR